MDSSDNMPLDGESAFTPDERKALRAMLREQERMTWARKKLKVFVPALVAVVVATWQIVEWVQKHIRYTP
jgi:hypothetical protein